MSLLVVLPACSLLGAQMELVPRIFFSAWSVHHNAFIYIVHVSSEGLEHVKLHTICW